MLNRKFSASKSPTFHILTVANNVKKVCNHRSISENKELLKKILDPHLVELLTDKNKNQQKILELCHLGKFIILSEKKLKIKELTEKPDFLLTHGQNHIGLEHQVIVDFKAKKREGFFEDIFKKAEERLRSVPDLPNFLANCYIRPYIEYPTSQKENLVTIVETVVHEYVVNGYLMDNPIIDEISKMPHSQINITPNLGAWWEKDISAEEIIRAVKKKEQKIMSYKEKGFSEQWLLMVIGSTGESSYEMDEHLEIQLETEFDRVFILEDFKNNLFQLK